MQLQAFDLYRRIGQIHDTPSPAPENLRAKYILLHKVLTQACYQLTADVSFVFANLFSRLDYVCKHARMTPSDRFAIQTLRRNCHAALGDRFQPSMEEYLYDLRAIVRFVSLAYGEDIPASFVAQMPPSNRPFEGSRHSRLPYLRAAVASWNDTEILAATDSEEDPFILIDYARAGYDGDQHYLKDLLQEDMQLNLLDVSIDENNRYLPRLIVVHPDYLLDISTLSACFREYGHHPFNYFLNRIQPRPATYHVLLGNLASQFLDDYINETADAPVDYARTLKKFFATAALDFCTCSLPSDFHQLAGQQMQNIRSVIHRLLPLNVPDFDRSRTLLEASFICEALGLQGRADLLQQDLKILIEQKSGKRDEYRHRHKEDHFVQMMLYQGVLQYNFSASAEQLQSFLLYSKYPDGLTAEHFSEQLFRESIRLRNRIVVQEMAFADGDIGRVCDQLSTDLLNEAQVQNRLWTDFQEPQLATVLQVLKHATPLAKAYFQRMFTFVAREQVLAKTGGRTDANTGFAALWHLPVAEKLEAGNLLMGLKLHSKHRSRPDKGFDVVVLDIPPQEEDFLPNFRPGDIIVFYAYQGEPDVRRSLLMKGHLTDIRPDQLTLQLRNGQQNPDLIGSPEDTFAIEHDASDLSATQAMRGLYAFLAARTDRKELLLGVRPPTADTSRTLRGDYGRFNPVILQQKQCNDYFLLVGPPGTGKTSCALRYMVEEALTDADASLLLLSYTNRSVDEICDMLVSSGIAGRHRFIRLGGEFSCDERFRQYLLQHSLDDCPRLEDIRHRLLSTRIVVGTTTALNSRLNLLGMKRFSLAIIDEASQILEPDLIGILSARCEADNAIGKFVLIGDYKQLPAIALQGEAEARVTDPLLTAIGLTDCRNSFFERLYRRSQPPFYSILRHQGRMHPSIADFPNHAFYQRERLAPVPLPHQEETSPYPDAPAPAHPIERLLLTRRMAFIPSAPPAITHLSEKANPEEARIVATLLRYIYRLTAEGFNAHRTVGVIVPYRGQIAMIRKEIARLDIPALNDISIDTVERYQGSQRDVILYSFTISQLGQLSFLASNTFREGDFWIDRKLNVAITRARKQLLLTGSPALLSADLTFYKLMEYIRLHNGYIATDAAHFCQGDFLLPEYTEDWELQSDIYPLSHEFADLYRRYAPLPADTPMDNTLIRELTSYGRTDFTSSDSQDSCATSILSPAHRVALYAHTYSCRHYSAARAVLESGNNWLHPLLRSVTGRILLCDFSYECGTSALAFADVCRSLPLPEIHYLGICPTPEIEPLTTCFWQSDAYRHVHSQLYPHLSAVPATVWSASSSQTHLVVFQLSNYFDRISPAIARQLADSINQIVHTYPHHQYVLLYRDDAGPFAYPHVYNAFCARLTPELRPLRPQMPFEGRFYYRSSGTLSLPPYHSFLYEIRGNFGR